MDMQSYGLHGGNVTSLSKVRSKSEQFSVVGVAVASPLRLVHFLPPWPPCWGKDHFASGNMISMKRTSIIYSTKTCYKPDWQSTIAFRQHIPLSFCSTGQLFPVASHGTLPTIAGCYKSQ